MVNLPYRGCLGTPLKLSFGSTPMWHQVWQLPHHFDAIASLAVHMGAEPQNSFKGGSRGPLYGKLTTRHHRLRGYVSPNQSCKDFGDFGQKSWLTSRHVCGPVTRDTCLLRVLCSETWEVYNFSHQHFSIWWKNIGLKAVLVEGYTIQLYSPVYQSKTGDLCLIDYFSRLKM